MSDKNAREVVDALKKSAEYFEGVMPSAHWMIVRGALSFGVALALTPFVISFLPGWIVVVFILFFGAGVGFSYGTGLGWRVPFAFGVGSLSALAAIWFIMTTLQRDESQGAVWLVPASAIGWGIAGAIGGASIRFLLLVPGMLAFGLGGAIGGYCWMSAIDARLPLAMWALSIGWGFAGTLAGGLFGAAVSVSSRER